MLTSLWTALPQAEKAKYVREAEQNLRNSQKPGNLQKSGNLLTPGNLQTSGNRGEVSGEINLGQVAGACAPQTSPDLPTGPSTSSLSNVPTSRAEQADRSNMKEESQAYKIFFNELRQVK